LSILRPPPSATLFPYTTLFRSLLWVIGMLIYLALMAEAFMGYVLPYGNMSYWGAQVIINLFGTIPGIGPDLVEWIRGDYGIGDRSEEHTSELQSQSNLVCRLLL